MTSPLPAAQRNSALSGQVSTTVGDHVGISGVVLLFFLLLQVDYLSKSIPFFWMVGRSGLWKWLVSVDI